MSPSPMAEANNLSTMLRQVYAGEHRFPVDVRSVALEVSGQRFPNEPIRSIEDLNSEGLEGVLARHPNGRYWKIGYSSAGRSPERVRFTLAHEFGHYLLHRKKRNRFECTELDMHDWDSTERAIESEADLFASYLLMPLDDFRLQVDGQPISIELLQHCADRYGVSLMAAALKWIEVAPRRAVVVAVRDGFLLWARSNRAARKMGTVLRTRVSPPIEVPVGSLLDEDGEVGVLTPRTASARLWFPDEDVELTLIEHAFVAVGKFSYKLGLLILPDGNPRWETPDNDALDELDGRMSFRR